MQSHLIWFNTLPEYTQEYYEYWQKNIAKIKQTPKSEILQFLENLKLQNIIQIPIESNNEIDEKIVNTKRNLINVCPSISLIYSYKADHAKQLDKKDIFSDDVKNKIIEGLGILNEKNIFLK